jgi:hypothetical protein
MLTFFVRNYIFHIKFGKFVSLIEFNLYHPFTMAYIWPIWLHVVEHTAKPLIPELKYVYGSLNLPLPYTHD